MPLNGIHRIVALDTLLAYQDFNEEFKIYNNYSRFQLGAIIIQKGKPIDFYGRKITDAQKRYTVTARDLLNIVENLK